MHVCVCMLQLAARSVNGYCARTRHSFGTYGAGAPKQLVRIHANLLEPNACVHRERKKQEKEDAKRRVVEEAEAKVRGLLAWQCMCVCLVCWA